MKKDSVQDALKFIFDKLEKEGAVTDVGPDHYDYFLNISEKTMELVIRCILADRSHYINEQILSKKWTRDEEIYQYVMNYLESIALGILAIGEEHGKLVLMKPVGPPPDDEMTMKLSEKIKSTKPLIEKIIWEYVEKDLERKGSAHTRE